VSVTINAGQLAVIPSGPYGNIARNFVILSGGVMYVEQHGAAVDTTISAGGIEYVFDHAVDGGASVYGSQLVEGIQASAAWATVDRGGTQSITFNGQASWTTVNNGTQDVGTGGTALSATINNNGVQIVENRLAWTGSFAGGVASATTVNWGGREDVLSGGTTYDTVLNFGRENVSSGGMAFGTIVNFGGVETVSSGGNDYAATVLDGGEIDVNGVARYDYIAGGVQDIFSGGLSISAAVAQGATGLGTQDIERGGVASGTQVFASGEQVISSGGMAISTNVFSGGQQIVQSGGRTLYTHGSGSVDVMAGGVASSSTVAAGGGVLVLAGGVTDHSTIQSLGTEWVAAGGIARDSHVLGGSFLVGELDVFGVAFNTVLDGGSLNVSAGGTASGTAVNYLGGLEVASGATAIDTVVQSGGQETVSGMDRNVQVRSGGTQYIVGGVAIGAVLDGGAQVVNSGTVLGATLFGAAVEDLGAGTTAIGTSIAGAFADQFVEGRAIDTAVHAGFQTVLAGGVASGTVISAGATELVSGGGTTVNTTISGGTLRLEASAAVVGAITFAGTNGTLQIEQGPMPTNVISGFAPTDTIDLVQVPFDPGGSVRPLPGNVLQLVEYGTTYRLNLDPAQNFAGDRFYINRDVSTGGTLVTLIELVPPPLKPGLASVGAADKTGSPSTALLAQHMASTFPSSGLAQSNGTLDASMHAASQAATPTLVHIRQ
jgi:autotransporter passenger strand-loop-strand repeat protein